VNILDSRRRVGLELSVSLPKQELNRCKVALVDAQVLRKLGAGELLEVNSGALPQRRVSHGHQIPLISRRAVMSISYLTYLRLLAAFPETMPVQSQHLLLESRISHLGCDWDRMCER
jgi:hypothetical protein